MRHPEPAMTPISDPRPFRNVLIDWLARHSLSAYAGAKVLSVPIRTMQAWASGSRRCTDEWTIRQAMTAHDVARSC